MSVVSVHMLVDIGFKSQQDLESDICLAYLICGWPSVIILNLNSLSLEERSSSLTKRKSYVLLISSQ